MPVTADIEAGYGETPADVGRSIREILGTGVVGFNLEDGTVRPDMPVRPLDDAVARIAAARDAANAAGVPAVINARVDLYLKNVGDPASRFDEAVRRGKAYLRRRRRLHLSVRSRRRGHNRAAGEGSR